MMNNAHLAENKFSNGTKTNEKTKHTSAAKPNQLRILNFIFQIEYAYSRTEYGLSMCFRVGDLRYFILRDQRTYFADM